LRARASQRLSYRAPAHEARLTALPDVACGASAHLLRFNPALDVASLVVGGTVARYSTRDSARLREVASELGCVREGAASALSWLPSTLRDVLGVEKAMAFSVVPREERVFIDDGHVSGISKDFFPATNAWLVDKPVLWTAYNPLRPEPLQRNRSLSFDDLRKFVDPTAVPIAQVYARFGLMRCDQVRALVCEGASLLAYVGVLQTAPIERRQQRMLAHLIPAMRRRLSTERLLRTAGATRLLLDAALEEIAAAAFVLGAQGTVLEANLAGQEWLAHEGAAGRLALREAARAPAHASRVGFRVVPIGASGAPSRYLTVRAASEDVAGKASLRRAAVRWGFTAREAMVLEYLAEGLTTRTIAAELGIAERTVETHLTRMYEKAQVETRGELVARARG
jgi:DNA-binding CsgD family transcriptional regulator